MSRFVIATLIAVAACLGRGAPAAAQPPKVYAVLVLDTNADNNLKLATEQDRKIIRNVLEGGIGQGLVISELSGTDVTFQKLRAHLDKLPIRKDVDTLVCYVACHGGVDQKDPTRHFLQFNGGGKPEVVMRDKLRKALTDRNPRLTVLLTDSCSDAVALQQNGPDIGVLSPVPAKVKPVAELAPTKEPSLPGFGRLFLDTTGIVDINASRTGDYAWFSAKEGGIFTRAIGDTFACMKNESEITWPVFYRALKINTRDTYIDWRESHIATIEPKIKELSPAQVANFRLLKKQQHQFIQAYYLDGVRLKVVVEDEPDDGGVRVTELPINSPAKAAGVRFNDLIVAVDGKKVTNAKEFTEAGGAVLAAAPDATAELKITVRRNGMNEVIVVSVPPLQK